MGRANGRAPQRYHSLSLLYITAAYWFTASTSSFANPAVTVENRMLLSF
jgi:hypothetical protein